MGTSVKALYNEPKQDFEVVTEAAAAIVVDAAHIQLWVGATVDATHQRADIMRGLNTCYDRLKELVPAFPVTDVVNQLTFLPGAATSLGVFTSGAGVTLPLETEVVVLYHQDYVSAGGRPAATQLFRGMFIELWERFLEERKAA